MKKKQIIASLREELDAMRQRAESAEKKLFCSPVWADADDEEIDFKGGRYCLASEIDFGGGTFPAGTDACLHVMDSTSRRKGLAVEAGNSYPCPNLLGEDTFKPCTGWLRLWISLFRRPMKTGATSGFLCRLGRLRLKQLRRIDHAHSIHAPHTGAWIETCIDLYEVEPEDLLPEEE